MKLLIIGGNGFIGTPLANQLLRQGHRVAVLHRGANKSALPPEVEPIRGDRNRLHEMGDPIRRFAPDVVIDMILSSGKQAEALLQTMAGITRRIVALSSMDVYRACGVLHQLEPGPLEPLPLTEDSPLRSRLQAYPAEALRQLGEIFSWLDDEYDKIPVERALMSDPQMSATILRLPMVYGPGDPLHRLFPLIKRMDDGRQKILFAEDMAAWRGPRGCVENVAAAIALAVANERAAGRIYNVAEEPAFSEMEWARKVAAEAGWRGEFVVLPRERTPQHLLLPGNTAQHWVASSQRIREELGYQEPVALPEAIRRTIAWERASPPTQVRPEQFDYAAEDAAAA